jgi:hypothetical protein
MSRAALTGTAVTVLVTAAIGAGIYLLGSPAAERARRFDERRVEDLSGIARALDIYWTRSSRLPASLQELQTEFGTTVRVTDPATDVPYEFRTLQGGKYEICASFDGGSRDSDRGVDAGFWSHRAGRQCFQRAAESVR